MGRQEKFGFIGGGNMAEALIKGLLQSGRAQPQDIMVFDVDPGRRDYLALEYKVNLADDNPSLVRASTVAVLAVKPQIMDRVLVEIASSLTPEHLVISMAAGVTLLKIQSIIPASVPAIRVMPNTPALVLTGASALSPGAAANKDHMTIARAIFEAVGMTTVVEEKHMDVVTGLSGSGPAYIFVLLEAMADGGVQQGLHRKQAYHLACQTVMGAAKLALESSEMGPGQLKDMVTSPGGTSAAGLHALERGGFRGLVMDAIGAATKRSCELGRKK